MRLTTAPTLSIVVPVYNEEEVLPALYEALCQTLDAATDPTAREDHPTEADGARGGLAWEVIFVDDCSRDRSPELLRTLCDQDDRVRSIRLSRNFGQQMAITAGLEHAQGRAVVIMDADLQHPPQLIPEMLDLWSHGYHVVYTQRRYDESTGALKRWTSSLFYRIYNAISDVDIVAGAADFRLLDRVVVDCLVQMRERSRFVRGMIGWLGFRQVGIPFTTQERAAGTTKYSLSKMVTLAIDGLTSTSMRPLRWAAYLGVVSSLSVFPYGLWAVYQRIFTDQAVPGWASLIVAVLFLGGVQLITLGLLGEYVGRIYTEVKQRPLYVAQEKWGFRRGQSRRGDVNHGLRVVCEGRRNAHDAGPVAGVEPIDDEGQHEQPGTPSRRHSA